MGMECEYACARLWRDCVSVRDVAQRGNIGQILMRVACVIVRRVFMLFMLVNV